MRNSKFSLSALVLALVAVVIALLVLSTRPPASQSEPAKSVVANTAEPNKFAEPAAPITATPSSNPALPSVGGTQTPVAPVAGGKFPSGAPSASSPGSSVRSMALPSPSSSAGSTAHNGQAPSLGGSPSSGGASAGFSIYRTPAEILAGKDLSDPVQRAVAESEIADAEEARYDAVLAKAARLGIPVRLQGPGNKIQILHEIRGTEPLYRTTLNANAAISTGANLIRQTAPYNLSGAGLKVGVWDGGSVRNTHQEFGTSRVVKRNSTVANDDHATHVAGTIGATGVQASAKGMAPLISIDSYDWNSDYAEMTAAGAATALDPTNKVPISNHSYGYNATSADMGRYEDECNTTDALALGLPYYLIFWAAGNEQDTLTALGGYQSITFNGLAKNIMTVGAAEDAVTSGVRDVSKGTLAYFSSMGPCDDGRIKPDIVANGVSVNSPVSTSDTAYDATYSGTSMATPNAVGSAVLLQQLYKTNFSGQLMPASMLKALMIHTADDMGRPGPDYQYGWGYMNAKVGADLILAHKASLAAPKMIENSIDNANKVRTTSFVWDGSSPIRATVVWTDPAGAAQTATNSRTRNLVNDLDLKVTAPDGTTSYLPYVMPFVGTWTTNSMSDNAIKGVNKVDNVERVDIPSPTQPGTYTVTVGMYNPNSLTGSSQVYSLIVTGGQNIEANPPPVVSITAPADGAALLPGTPIVFTANATDMAVGGQPGQVAKVEFFDGDTLLGEDASAPYQYSWSPATSGPRVLTAKATDNENSATVSSPVTVNVLVGNGAPSITTFAPSGGVGGESVVVIGTNLGVATGVRFGAFTSSFVANSPSQLTATVPDGAVTAPIVVSNAYGTATTITNFNILPIIFREDFSSITGGNNTSSGGSSTAWIGNSNFPTGANDYQAGGAVKLGTSSAVGSITSRAINLSGNGGAFTLSFKVKGWSTVEGQIKVTAGAQSQIVSYAATITGEFETKTLNFTSGTAATTIKIETTAKRAFVDDVTVTAEAPSSPPVITSPSSAAGIAGQAFSYQVTASNSPTSFGASNLPAGLSVDTISGVISGIPAAAGTTVATVSAANATGIGTKDLTVTILPSGGGGGGAVVVTNGVLAGWDVSTQTNFGVSPLAATTYATNLINVGGLTRSSGVATSASPANRAWGGNGWTNTNAFFTVTLSAPTGYRMSVTNLSTFDYRRPNTGPSSGSLQYSTNGSNFVAITNVPYTATNSAGGAVGPIPLDGVTALQNVPSGVTVTLRVVNSNASASTGTWYVFDRANTSANDFAVSGTIESTNATPSPSLSASGSLSAVDTTYGTASATPTSFTLAGSNLVTGITVAPPSGFEVSAGDTNSFAGKDLSIIVGSSGTVSNTPVYVRLAADTDVGSYSGDIVCSTVGASNAIVPTVASTVSAKPITVSAEFLAKIYGSEDPELIYAPSEPAPFSGSPVRDAGENVGTYRIRQGTLSAGSNYAISFIENDFEIGRKNLFITANNLTKPFGQTLALGAEQTGFSSSGLVNGETVGSVTITASGGTAAEDPVGVYVLTPSLATGGTFEAGNYRIFYNTGALTVTSSAMPAFDDWMNSYPELQGNDKLPTADPDKDGVVNLIEYYMGLSPVAPNHNAIGVSWGAGNPSSVAMTYRRATNTTGVTASVIWKSLLSSGDWSSNGVSENVVQKAGYEEVTATVTNAPGDAQKFLRLQVTQP